MLPTVVIDIVVEFVGSDIDTTPKFLEDNIDKLTWLIRELKVHKAQFVLFVVPLLVLMHDIYIPSIKSVFSIWMPPLTKSWIVSYRTSKMPNQC